MKAAVLHINTCNRKACSPTPRLADFIATTFGLPMVHNELTAIEHGAVKYDTVFVLHGLLHFANPVHREVSKHMIQQAKRVVWVQNDYAFKPDRRVWRDDTELWTSMDDGRGCYINWNMLTWQNDMAWPKPTIDGLMYYGAWREGREKYFRRYLPGANVSTYPRSAGKFEAIGAHVYKPFKKYEQLQAFKATVYLEDEYSHNIYTSPAHRFYECLFLHIPMFFDESCVGTFQQSGFNICRWVVNSRDEVDFRMKHWQKEAKEQCCRWHMDYREVLKRVMIIQGRKRYGL